MELNRKAFVGILYFSAYIGYIRYKVGITMLPTTEIINRDLFASIYNVYCDTVYTIKKR